MLEAFPPRQGSCWMPAHMSVSYLQTSALLPQFSCSKFCQFCKQEISEVFLGFFFALFITSNILLGFWGFFNCQKVQKTFLFLLKQAKNRLFFFFNYCLFVLVGFFFPCFPWSGGFPLQLCPELFSFPEGRGWMELPSQKVV